MSKALSKDELDIAQDFLNFHAPSQFHVTANARARLEAAGFAELSEREGAGWEVKPNGKYFFTRNQSCIVAFAVGGQWQPGNGFIVQGAHTDSPVPKVKPVSKVEKEGYLQLGVEMYGGGLWNTWFDRDLSLAGKVILSKPDGGFETRLVDLKKPVLTIPNLAIHLNRSIYKDGFKPNKESHVVPVIATAVKDALARKPAAAAEGEEEAAAGKEPAAKKAKVDARDVSSLHHPVLMNLVAEELNVDVACIRDFELCLYDTHKAALVGAYSEFVAARGLDNQLMAFLTTRALIDSLPTLADDKQIRMTVLFDNEEVGSNSQYGAGSLLLRSALERINGQATLAAAQAKSYFVSADMAHAIHPNYSDKHESRHKPSMHKGLVIKQNANQRYATTSVTSFLLCELARKHDLPVQKFVVRQDMGCGSTIGPMLSASAELRTIDVGVAQLGMHSVRELCGTEDLLTSHRLLTAVFSEVGNVDSSLDA